MSEYASYLQWIDSQHETMCRLVSEWGGINSGSNNILGLNRMAQAIRPLLAEMGETRQLDLPPRRIIDDRGQERETPLGPALHAAWRGAGAKLRIFLGIHFDTVYEADHPFQKVEKIDAATLRGPGVTDAKGGLVVLLTALSAVRRSPWADRLSLEVLLNPDEELGSAGSAELLAECGRRNDIGLVFEPALPDGDFVSNRKGSSNLTVVVRGRAAHVGRDYAAGRNAIHALAQFVVDAASIPDALPGVVVNIGNIQGGGPINVVPDLAICRLNLRAQTEGEQSEARQMIEHLVEKMSRRDGIVASLHITSQCPPKPLDGVTLALLEAASACAQELGLKKIGWQPSGGVSDGNRLAAVGLATLDTLGACGGNIHSSDEFIRLDSLVERARLAALLLMKLASGEVTIPSKERV